MNHDTLHRPLQAAAPLPPAGSMGGRYVLSTELGRGSTSTVWLALDTVLGRPVAVKEFHRSGEPRHGSTARAALHEANMAARFAHHGVVHVHDVLEDGQRPWLVMEFLDGPSLAAEIRRRGRVPRGRVRDVAGEVLQTLEVVHDAGVVHRDVKPGNLVTAGTGRMVLTDFGLAAEIGAPRPHPSAPLVGSAPYLAPETWRDGRSTPATDLFALGVTLYSAIEGHLPFAGDTAGATLRALRERPLPPMRHAGSLRPLVEGLLRKDPRRRLTGPEAFAYWAEADQQADDGTDEELLADR